MCTLDLIALARLVNGLDCDEIVVVWRHGRRDHSRSRYLKGGCVESDI